MQDDILLRSDGSGGAAAGGPMVLIYGLGALSGRLSIMLRLEGFRATVCLNEAGLRRAAEPRSILITEPISTLPREAVGLKKVIIGDASQVAGKLDGSILAHLQRPVDAARLLNTLRTQVLLDLIAVDHRRARSREGLSALTLRERHVTELVVAGLSNKEIAGRLGLTVSTVKGYRAMAMTKLMASNTAEFVGAYHRLKSTTA